MASHSHTLILSLIVISFFPSNAAQIHNNTNIISHNNFNTLLQNYFLNHPQQSPKFPSTPLFVAAILCFIASSISSAGGIGGGGIFIPILSIVAGLDLKTASSLSAFMVTGGSAANVVYNLCNRKTTSSRKNKTLLIDYDIALSSQPCMLLGVSVGVICNVAFPEWLITVLFAVFLAWSTCKTCKSGLLFWKKESREMMKIMNMREEDGGIGNTNNTKSNNVDQPLLIVDMPHNHEHKMRLPCFEFGVLLFIWFSFFSLYLLRGNKYGQSIIPMEPCGVGYWIISSVQIPLAVVFTAWILSRKESLQDQPLTLTQGQDLSKKGSPNKLVFPIMALIAGILGGVFGIGGGMLVSPLLLQVGIAPEVTAATCSFMVFFSATMSASQYLLLGMEHIEIALILAIICFVASLVGLLVVQSAIRKYGRASIIVFSVSIVMALSIVLMTSFGAIEVWRDYKSGKYMGFKLPC